MLEENPKKSSQWIFRMDPRHKVAIAVLFSFTVALCYHPYTLYAAFFIALSLLVFSSIKLSQLIKGLSPLIPFILLLLIILPLTTRDQSYYVLGPLEFSPKGLYLTQIITLKSISILSVFIIFIGTIPIPTMAKVLCFFKMPDKLVFLFMVTYRYIGVIQSESKRLMTAAKIRGFTPRTTLYTYKVYAYMIAMIFLKSFLRSKRVHEAMKLRGFCGTFPCVQIFYPLFQNPFSLILWGSITLGLGVLEITLNILQ